MKPFVDSINNEFCLGDVIVYFDGRRHKLRVVTGGKFDIMNYHLTTVDTGGTVLPIVSSSNGFSGVYIVTQQYMSNNDHSWVLNICDKHIFNDSGFKDMSPTDPGVIIGPIMRALNKCDAKGFYKRYTYGYTNGTYGKQNNYQLINNKKTFNVSSNITIDGNKYRFILTVNAPYPKPAQKLSIDRWKSGEDYYAARLQFGKSYVTITSEGNVVSSNELDICGVNPLTSKDIVSTLKLMIEKCEKS